LNKSISLFEIVILVSLYQIRITMKDLHHTYASVHNEHHAWRKDLLNTKSHLASLAEQLKSESAAFGQEHIDSLGGKLKNHFSAIENKLSSLTQADKLMNESKDKNSVISQELFALNSKLRQEIIFFDKEVDQLTRNFEKFKP
jgi:chromosome segregation ATPase